MTSAHPRITIEADKRDGKPCARGMRITVNDILRVAGSRYEDFAAVYAFAADMQAGAEGLRKDCDQCRPAKQ